MIDFTNCKVNPYKLFSGANGYKLSISHEGKDYMLKFPSHAKINKNISYSNSVVSEHIGCKIFNLLGVPAQNTILGSYTKETRKHLVVACEDIEVDNLILKDFISVKNSVVDSLGGGAGTSLENILVAIEEQKLIDSKQLTTFFWKMFIIDTFIGNFDRHNGNWGFTLDNINKTASIAPVYDCGSCLFSEMDTDTMLRVMSDKDELKYRLFVVPKSAIHDGNTKISYFDFLASNKNPDCTEALKEIVPRINMEAIETMIDEIDMISSIERDFYKFMLRARKEYILDAALDKLSNPLGKMNSFR